MENLDMMKDFASTFVGDDFYLIIKANTTSVLVHTIEIIQKIDDSCKFTDIPMGGYFFRIKALDPNNQQAYILCNWSEQLLQNLLTQRHRAKEAGYNKIIMTKETQAGSNDWVLMWGDESEIHKKEMIQKASRLKYIY